MSKPQPTYRASIGFGSDLTDDEAEVLFDTGFRPKLKELLAAELASRVQSYFTPLEDAEVPEQFRSHLGPWRKFAVSLDYKGPVLWQVKAGFTVKHHAPRTGACYKDWQYLQDWSFQNDEPTKDSCVFWVPRLVPESTNKSVGKQNGRLAAVREEFALPAHHLASFGSGALVAGLILANFKRTGERVPVNRLWVRTDTFLSDGGRFGLGGFEGGGLGGVDWRFGGGGLDGLGVFPLGVELIEKAS